MITVTALKWAPPFAQGRVRDHRARWVLNEVGWPYAVRLLDAEDQQNDAYRSEQPFGQIPVLEEDGRPALFETGAILLDVATRADMLLPKDDGDQARAICWLFAALNSVEPPLISLLALDFMIEDEAAKSKVRPAVLKLVRDRLDQLAAALGPNSYLVGTEFTIADMMMSSVLMVLDHTDLIADYPTLRAYRDRCHSRAAFKKAIADQLKDFARHTSADMKLDRHEDKCDDA